MTFVPITDVKNIIQRSNPLTVTFPESWVRSRTTKRQIAKRVSSTTDHEIISDIMTELIVTSPSLTAKINRAEEEKAEDTRLTFQDVFGEEL